MKEFTEADGPYRAECLVRKPYECEMRQACAEVSMDGLGSVTAKVPGSDGGPRIMLDAHLDEVGMMVCAIKSRGFIKVQRLSGWLGTNKVDQRWTFLYSKGAYTGGERNAGRPHLHAGIDHPVRQSHCANQPVSRTGNNRYAARGWGDRIGLLVQIEALKQLEREGVKIPRRSSSPAQSRKKLAYAGR